MLIPTVDLFFTTAKPNKLSKLSISIKHSASFSNTACITKVTQVCISCIIYLFSCFGSRVALFQSSGMSGRTIIKNILHQNTKQLIVTLEVVKNSKDGKKKRDFCQPLLPMSKTLLCSIDLVSLAK